MKSKNIPADIRKKTIKEAQNEIQDIIASLESKEAKLEESLDMYNRMLKLNYHIQEEFKKKAKEIQNTKLKKDKVDN